MRTNPRVLLIVPASVIALAFTGGTAEAQTSGRHPSRGGTGIEARRGSHATRAERSGKARRVRFIATGPQPTILPPLCDAQQHCAYPGTQTLQVTGDLNGKLIQASGAVSLPDGSRFTTGAINLFVGSVKGCGTGTAAVRLFESGTTNPATGVGRWEVVPGFGTDQLTALRGRGTGTGGVVDGIRKSTQTGRVTCNRG